MTHLPWTTSGAGLLGRSITAASRPASGGPPATLPLTPASRSPSRRPCSRSFAPPARVTFTSSRRRSSSRPVPDPHVPGLPSQRDRRLPHRGQGRVAASVPDHEPAPGLKDDGWLGPEMELGLRARRRHRSLNPRRRYTDENLTLLGWGNSTYPHAFEFADRVGTRRSSCSTATRAATSHPGAPARQSLSASTPPSASPGGCEGAVHGLGAQRAREKRRAP